MIEYVNGDATRPIAKPAFIAHVCNDVGAWGAGFVVALSARWKQPEKVYRSTPSRGLGEVQFAVCERDIMVANMVAQYGLSGPRPWVRYDALDTCLRIVFDKAKQLGASVHAPRIGCGIAGGKWSEVEPIILRTQGDVRVVVYDFEVGQ